VIAGIGADEAEARSGAIALTRLVAVAGAVTNEAGAALKPMEAGVVPIARVLADVPGVPVASLTPIAREVANVASVPSAGEVAGVVADIAAITAAGAEAGTGVIADVTTVESTGVITNA
jgi:hypothetical protein